MQPPSNQATILLVDDDDEIRTTATMILSLEGYRVFAASDGQEGLAAIKEGKCTPHLIISDIAMPQMDGYAFFEAVRQISAMRAVPFIFLTAFGSRRHIHLGRELGVDDYLVKPFEASELIAAVRSRLGRAQDMRQQVEGELDDARRMLVQLLSHELRTPLTYITGGFELLADLIKQKGGTQDVNASMNLIRSGAQRLTRLAEQVVSYTELTSGFARRQLEEYGESLALTELIENAITAAYPEMKARSTYVETNYALAENLEVRGVAKLLTMAIYEVIRNAVAYSSEHSKVWLHVEQKSGEAIITVTDHGRGIPEADQATIWELMAQSDRQRHEQQGAGMGLPLVRQTLRLHGGDASLVSQQGQGTVVTLRLPLANTGT